MQKSIDSSAQRHWAADVIENSRAKMKMLQERYLPPTGDQSALSGYNIIQERSLKANSARTEGRLTLTHATLGSLEISFNEGHYESCKRLCSRYFPAQVLKGDSKASVIARALMRILTASDIAQPIHFSCDLGDPYLLIDVSTLSDRVLCPSGKRKICDEEFLTRQPLIARHLNLDRLFSEFKKAIGEDLSEFSLDSFEKILCICELLNRTSDQIVFTDADRRRKLKPELRKLSKANGKLREVLAKIRLRPI